jgi:hypothetical protein
MRACTSSVSIAACCLLLAAVAPAAPTHAERCLPSDRPLHLDRVAMSETPKDARQVEREVQEVGRHYVQLLKDLHSGRSYEALSEAGLVTRLERMLAEDFTYTDPKGRRYTRNEELAAYRDLQTTIETADIIDQHIRALGDMHALESITVRYSGMHAGQPYTVTKRSTLTWAWRDTRWQLASDHSTIVDG